MGGECDPFRNRHRRKATTVQQSATKDDLLAIAGITEQDRKEFVANTAVGIALLRSGSYNQALAL